MPEFIHFEYIVYFAPMLIIWLTFIFMRSKKHKVNMQSQRNSIQAGLTEPASLHPVIDESRCLACGTCVTACPEGNVLGLINGKSTLINPTHCIGHAACKAACPFDAITLVFGTAKRGMDIPTVSDEFETNVPGLFIAGELGGMGLIRNAITQGRQALEAIKKRASASNDGLHDVVIIGAGPAGFSASLGAIEHKLDYVTLEQDSLGGTVSHYPRGKLVMTAPVKLPLIGTVKFTETSKEALLEFWQEVEKKCDLKINYHERMEEIIPDGDGFIVKTKKSEYRTRSVLLSIGRRGTPRKLNVPGEEVSKVVYRLIDPEQYKNNHVLVVGGGDSALEAATSIAEEEGTTVTLSYRSGAFSRAKEKNRNKVDKMQEEGQMNVLYKSNVKSISEKSVSIDHDGEVIEIDNDAIIVSAGGILPTPFLKSIGIEVETKHGSA